MTKIRKTRNFGPTRGAKSDSERKPRRTARGRTGEDRPTRQRRDERGADRPSRQGREEHKPFERRPRIKLGPWADSAYKVTQKPVVRPIGTPAPVKLPVDAPVKTGDGKERLQKVLARAGVASRRNAEVLILEGAVTVNGRPVTELGTKVDSTKDKIKVNGKLIYTEVEPIYAAIYKPRGVISSLGDPEGRPAPWPNRSQFARTRCAHWTSGFQFRGVDLDDQRRRPGRKNL